MKLDDGRLSQHIERKGFVDRIRHFLNNLDNKTMQFLCLGGSREKVSHDSTMCTFMVGSCDTRNCFFSYCG